MAPDRWQRAEEILGETLERPAEEREAYAQEACGADAELLAEVLSLLRADVRAGGFLDRPLLTPVAEGSDWIGRRLGPYRLVGKLGEGGMSTVYLATREDEQYRREVAIKVVRAGLVSEDQLRRFRAERQILASLDHPHIARLYDGGTTEDGLPYLVMERIEGLPIDEYCDLHRRTVAERIELFRLVCAAVHYAHQNLVVHRDLKPGNILVTAEGVPKLLDFGIAKLLRPELESPDSEGQSPAATKAWMRLMTPDYASPEQVQGRPVTTGSDVYSLGLLLYKLLTGGLPHSFAGQSPEAIERAIAMEEPEKPSAVVGKGADAEHMEAVARARGARPAQLRRLLAGDLDTVVLNALRRDPQRRYGSAEQLSEDLRRHLEGLPVLAHPDSFPYRARKFVRRHRLAVGATAAVLLLVLGAAVAFALQSARVARERDRAERERIKAEKVAEFLAEVFTVSHPADPRIEPMTAQEVLDRGVAKLEKIRDQPQLQATLMHVLGRIYRDLGNYERAGPLLERALAAQSKLPDADPAEALENMEDLGVLYIHRGDYDRAEELLTETLERARAKLGDTHRLVPWTLSALAVVRQVRGDHAGAEERFREALELFAAVPDADPLEVSATQGNLALLLFGRGRYDEAEALQRAALATARRVLGEDDLTTALANNNLALMLATKGDYRGAIAGAQSFVAYQRRIAGDAGEEHPDLAGALANLAVLYSLEGRHEESEKYARQALALRRKLFGERHSLVAESELILGRALRDQGKLTEAEPLLRSALSLSRELLGAEHPNVAKAASNLAKLFAAKGDAAAAEPLFAEALAQQRKLLGPDHPDLSTTLMNFGQFLASTGRAQQAEPLLEEALGIRRRKLPATHPAIAEAERALAECRRPSIPP